MKVTCCRKLPCAVVAGLVFSLPVSLPAMAQTQIFKCESHGHVAYQDFPDQYAFLSQVVYKDLEEGKDATRTSLFIVKEVYSDPSGFYGAIFQDTVTNELVVAFRGTELPDDTVRDAIETDEQMFVDGVNQQLDGARRLMEKAIELSATGGIEGGAPNPVQLSVTGHSLGGSLAQVMSYDYNLYGETFNAYGATGVGDVPRGATVPEGQNTI
ncbi:MAG: hypothetical protein KGJ32_03035, partial [Xanthomonadaceae bacterium]|nr:hypothetical protein [Xanthomonadaceae bacterium]